MKQETDFPIYEFDLTLIADFFRRCPRQGPGSKEQTLRALSFTGPLPPMPLIADMGCGTGAQTAVLARYTGGTVHALDLLPEMVEGVKQRTVSEGLQDHVIPYLGSMGEPPFAGLLFDLIWAEGSIYNIGFENGFRLWRDMLAPGGCVAVTETCWLSERRPREMAFMEANFPEIDQISGKLAVIERAGYEPVAHFILPRCCWTEEFYEPMEPVIGEFLRDHADSPAAKKFVREIREERGHYDQYGETYGYVFFIARKLG